MKQMSILVGAVVFSIVSSSLGAEVGGLDTVPHAPGGQGWSVLSGQTMGTGQTALMGQAGFPGISGTLLHGLGPSTDVGARFAFDYGGYGLGVSHFGSNLGIRFQGLLKLGLLETSKYNFALQFEPGPFFEFYGPGTLVGLTMPVKFLFGIPIASALMFNMGLDIPISVVFNSPSGFAIGFLVGGGFEYFIDRHLSVNFNMRVGPVITSYSYADLGFEALMGIAYRL